MAASVGALIPTRNPGTSLGRCLAPLMESACVTSVLVVDSASSDGTRALARRAGADVIEIDLTEFNHGATRELGRNRLGTEVVVMLSQDAVARSGADVDALVAPVVDGEVAAAYGRQVPRAHAGAIERFSREFSYPATGNVRALADAPRYGAALTFCSNAFAAYRNARLDAVGGFPRTPAHEDAIATARLLRAGDRVAYVADAVVEHSHPPHLDAEFRRYYEGGLARGLFRDELAIGGSRHGSLGRSYATLLLSRLWATDRRALPAAVAQVGVRWLAYRLGGLVAARRRMSPGVSGRA